MFPSTKRWTAAVEVINAADAAPLSKVLARMLRALPERKVSIFNEDETAQLREAFGLSETQLELLVGVSTFIFEQAAYATTPPDTLRTELLDAGMAEEPANAFGTTWHAGATECVRALKERAVLAPASLAAVDWQLCIGTADSEGGRAPRAHTMLQLDLGLPAAGGGGSGADARTPVHVRLGVEEMGGLLNKLDTIQAQMDKLS